MTVPESPEMSQVGWYRHGLKVPVTNCHNLFHAASQLRDLRGI